MDFKLVKSFMLALSLTTSLVSAQERPEAPASSKALMYNCTIENPEDLANSSLYSHYSVRPSSAVKLGISPADGLVIVNLQLSSGRFSLTPSMPIVYRTRIRSEQQLQAGQLVLKNVDLDYSDVVKVSLSNISNEVEGVISIYGADLRITCSRSEEN